MTAPRTLALEFSPSHVTTRPRATPADAGTRFRDALAQTAETALAGVERIVPFAAGGLSTAAALPSSGGGLGAATSGLAAVGGSGSNVVQESADQALELLALQQQIGLEQRQFTTVSNVMKARHDTAKNVVGNFR